MSKKTFIGYIDWIDFFDDDTTMEQMGQIFDAILRYQNGETNVKPSDPGARMVFNKIRKTMQDDADEYARTCAARSDAANKRWNNAGEKMQDNAKACKSMQKHSSASKSMQKDTDTDTETDTESSNDDEDARGRAHEAAASFELADGSLYAPESAFVRKCTEVFPDLDVKRELLRCALKHNAMEKRRRKNITTIEQYIANWMITALGEQQKAGKKAGGFADIPQHEMKINDAFWDEMRSRGCLV